MTPANAPWTIESKEGREDARGYWLIADGDYVAMVCRRSAGPDEELANACLIAAAPELLEALGNTLALAKLKFGNLDAGANAIFEQAEAAIAKAHPIKDRQSASTPEGERP